MIRSGGEPAFRLVLATATESFLETALRMQLEGPPDWSENVDKYLAEVRRPADD